MAAASESEVRAALRTRWRFVGADGLSEYLDRLAAQTARHVAGAPAAARVALVDEGSFRTLALPSGTLLVSLGALESLENEAELAFLLGHELGHAASSDALARLVRLGFDSVRREDGADGNAVWALAVEDLLRVGYGRRRERDADERAIEAMLSAGYDPAAARRLLQRLDERMHAGDARLAELAGSHPAPEERVRRIERMLHGRLRGDEPFRLNREVFRRVVGHDPASRPLGIVPLDPTELEPAGEIRGGVPGWLVKAAGVGLLAALILLLALLLSR